MLGILAISLTPGAIAPTAMFTLDVSPLLIAHWHAVSRRPTAA